MTVSVDNVSLKNVYINQTIQSKLQTNQNFRISITSKFSFPGNTVTQFNRKKADCVQCVLSKYMLITKTRLMKTTGSLNTKFCPKTNVFQRVCQLILKWVFNRSPEVSKSVFVDCCCLLLW